MATPTYTLIASTTVGSGKAAYIEFASIPSTYTDLKLVCSLRDDRTDTNVTDAVISYNGAPGGSTYNAKSIVYADGSILSGSSTGASSYGGQYENSGTATTNNFCNFEHTIFNYAGSTNKPGSTDGVAENNGTGVYFGFLGTLKTSTTAITSVRLTPYYGILNYVQYSTAYLYGIKNS
jgi:hypothetical protein